MNDQPNDAELAATDTRSPKPAKSLKGSTIEWWQLTTTWLIFMVMWGAPSGFVYMTKSVGMWEALSIRLQVPSTDADKPGF